MHVAHDAGERFSTSKIFRPRHGLRLGLELEVTFQSTRGGNSMPLVRRFRTRSRRQIIRRCTAPTARLDRTCGSAAPARRFHNPPRPGVIRRSTAPATLREGSRRGGAAAGGVRLACSTRHGIQGAIRAGFACSIRCGRRSAAARIGPACLWGARLGAGSERGCRQTKN